LTRHQTCHGTEEIDLPVRRLGKSTACFTFQELFGSCSQVEELIENAIESEKGSEIIGPKFGKKLDWRPR
jgi:hypothetical protein